MLLNNLNFLTGIKSQRLFQLLLNDEQYTAAIVIQSVKELFKIKRNLIRQLDEKTVYLYLDELIYKMATTETTEAGLYETKSFELVKLMSFKFNSNCNNYFLFKSHISVAYYNVPNGSQFNQANNTKIQVKKGFFIKMKFNVLNDLIYQIEA